ncbi:MAG TPA: LysR family transcriptional regulator [Solirubrobacteraceae bacterium]|jgi:DNA-binding transcriptional LysR family regulator
MEFRRGHLLYFVTVAEEGQITRAAKKLHLAQPALSQAIAQLEADLGIELLERHARGVRLTAAGEVFLEKARTAVAAWSDALETAQALARSRQGTIEFGFVGSPPGIDSPGSLKAFQTAHPDIDLRYRELAFPPSSTASWLAEVDVAACHLPPADTGVWTQTLRREGRMVLMPRHHRLAAREELRVSELLDETFVGFHPSVDAAWAGFWTLDRERGEPARATSDRAASPQEVLASLSVRDAITTVPESVARVVMNFPTGLVSVPLVGAEPTTIVLAGRGDRRGPLVQTLLNFAGSGQLGARSTGQERERT